MATETATIVFTDLVNSTALLSELGEDGFEPLRIAHYAALRRALLAHRGEEVKNLGDGLMVAFSATADAVAAAVAMQQEVHRLDREWPDIEVAIRVGIGVGDTIRDDGDFFGTPVVEAARLCAKATGGGILATDLVRLLCGNRGAHEFVPVGSLELKGIPEPVPTSEVRWEPLAQADDPAGLVVPFPPRLERRQRRGAFVGRDTELAALRDAAKDAAAGQRQVVAVRGEPGIGKTRLSIEFCRQAHAEGAIVLYGHCDEERSGGYQPFAEAIGHLLDHLPDTIVADHVARHGDDLATLVPSLRHRVTDLAGHGASDPETERLRMFDAATDLLQRAAAEAPVVLVLDDLHWASKPTVLMLRELIDRAESEPLLVLGTYRDTDIDREHPLSALLADLRRVDGVVRVGLAGLGDLEIVELMGAVAGHELDASGIQLAHDIRAETMGSPFFTIEVLQHLSESGAIEQVDGRWVVRDTTITLPESVRDVVGRRLDRLGDDVRSCLSVASVIGREFAVDVLCRTVDLDEDTVFDAIERAAAAGLLTELSGDRFAFVNALVRSTLLDELPGMRRRRVHGRIAEVLEEMSLSGHRVDPGALAQHRLAVVQASDIDRAVRYSLMAGTRAMEELAYEEAASYFERALGVLDDAGGGDPTVRVDVLLGVVRARRSHGDPGYRDLITEAIGLADRAGDATRLAAATLAWSRSQFWAGGTQVDEQYVTMLERALEVVGDGDPVVRARLLAQLGVEAIWHDDLSVRERYCDDAVRIARLAGDEAAVLDTLLARATALNDPGHLAQRIADTEEAATIAHRIANLDAGFRASYLRSMAALDAGDGARFSAGVDGLRASAHSLRAPQYQWLAELSFQCRALLRNEASDDSLAACYAIGERSGNQDAFSAFSIQLWVLRHDHGGIDELVDAVRMNIEAFPAVPAWKVAFLSMMVDLGRLDEAAAALEMLDGGAVLARNSVWLSSTTEIARAAIVLDDDALVHRLLETLVPYVDQVSVTANSMSLGSVHRIVGAMYAHLDEIEDAVTHLEAAVDVDDAIGARAMGTRSRIELAAVLTSRGAGDDLLRAATLLDEARAVMVDVPMPYDRDRLAAVDAAVVAAVEAAGPR